LGGNPIPRRGGTRHGGKVKSHPPRPDKALLPRLNSKLARTLHGDVAVVDGDIGAGGGADADALGGGPVAVGVAAGEGERVLGLDGQGAVVGLEVDGVLGRDDLQAQLVWAGGGRAG